MGFTDEITFKRETSLPLLIEREIERRIGAGELKPGDKINENALAGQIGVSRGPIREACRKLEQAGLLTIIVNRGVFVREISPEQIYEVREIRAALAQIAARKVVANITEAEVTGLEGCIAEMDAAIENGDSHAYFDLNLQFHKRLLDASKMSRLIEIYQMLDKELSLTRRRSLASHEAMTASNNEHKVILNALLLRDDMALHAAMASHSINSRARHLKTFSAGGNTTSPPPQAGD